MAWTTPGTAVAGAVLEADFWNSNVRDNTLALYAQSAYPYRNLLYNGAMQVAQRGTSTASITSGGNYYTADRWLFEVSSLGTWTESIQNDAPTGSGLSKSLKLLCTAADAAPAAGDYMLMEQRLEGQDLQRLKKGTASAETITLSFWVKSNVTGTYVCRLRDVDNTRHVCTTYTVTASGTWEKKELVFPADTTGAFDNDNAHSLSVQFWLGAGTTYTSGTLATSWESVTSANIAVGQTNLAAATNNYWQVTGVQLEAGSVATPFEFLPYGDELARCQRYYYLHASGNDKTICNGTYYKVDEVYGVLNFPVQMRVAPSKDFVTGGSFFVAYRNGGSDAFDTLDISTASRTTNAVDIIGTSNVSGTAGHGCWVRTNNASAYVAFSAEL